MTVKVKYAKGNNKFPQEKMMQSIKKNDITKPDSVNEIQVSDTDSGLTIGEDDDSVG